MVNAIPTSILVSVTVMWSTMSSSVMGRLISGSMTVSSAARTADSSLTAVHPPTATPAPILGPVVGSLVGGCENSLVSETTPRAKNGHRAHQSVPVGEEIGVFTHYDDARDMVNRLLTGGIPAQSVSIVGGDVTLVEHVVARYGYGRAAIAAALTGSWIGVFAGLLFTLTTPGESPAPLAAGGLIGAGLGMIVGMVVYTTRGSNRPLFRSHQHIIASTYRIIVDPEVGGKAKRVAAQEGGES